MGRGERHLFARLRKKIKEIVRDVIGWVCRSKLLSVLGMWQVVSDHKGGEAEERPDHRNSRRVSDDCCFVWENINPDRNSVLVNLLLVVCS